MDEPIWMIHNSQPNIEYNVFSTRNNNLFFILFPRFHDHIMFAYWLNLSLHDSLSKLIVYEPSYLPMLFFNFDGSQVMVLASILSFNALFQAELANSAQLFVSKLYQLCSEKYLITICNCSDVMPWPITSYIISYSTAIFNRYYPQNPRFNRRLYVPMIVYSPSSAATILAPSRRPARSASYLELI